MANRENLRKPRTPLQLHLALDGGQCGYLSTPVRANVDPCIIYMFFRRICPGLFLADNSVFLAIATMLYAFNISKAKDQQGAEITPAVEYDGFIR
jgi:hypothetical protein